MNRISLDIFLDSLEYHEWNYLPTGDQIMKVETGFIYRQEESTSLVFVPDHSELDKIGVELEKINDTLDMIYRKLGVGV